MRGDAEDPEYLFVGASLFRFVGTLAIAFGCLLLVHRKVVTGEARWQRSGTAYLSPLALLGLAPAGAIVLATWADAHLSVLAYVLVDLRWWWGAGLVGASIARLGRRQGWRAREWIGAKWAALPGSTRLFLAEGVLFLLLGGWAIVSSPYLRFTSVLHGDEPKYIRYCENFYQGRGLNIDGQRAFDELSLAYSPRVGRNLVHFVRALEEDASEAVSDVGRLLRHGFSIPFNRARYEGAWFFRGRTGGVYQVHNPGLSFLLFPAYFIDRHFISTSAGYGNTFPAQLPMTNLLCLVIWAVWGVVVFRFLRLLTNSDALSWVLAAAAMLTLPVSAFPFQIYPEAAAGLIVTATCAWLLHDPQAARHRTAVLAGLAVAYLPWLHVRFFVLSAVLAAWTIANVKSQRTAFGAAWGLGVAALCLYSYHLTGSLRPDAMYQTEGGVSAWEIGLAIESVRAYPFDRIWGLFPNAPIYLLSLPGWLILGRRHPRAAGLVALAIVALLVPSAGHGFTAAGATPLRHLVAVIPLLMAPLASTMIAFPDRRSIRVASLILLVLSLQIGWSYNRHHVKEKGPFIDASVSGWAPALVFPWTHGTDWEGSRANGALFAAWCAFAAGLTLLPVVVRPREGRPRAPALREVGAGAIALVVFGTGATALGGEPVRVDYLLPEADARAAAVAQVEKQEGCRLCYSSRRGEVGRADLLGDAVVDVDFRVDDHQPVSGEEVSLRLGARAGEAPAWVSAAVDLGDSQTMRVNVFGATQIRHAYRESGRRTAIAWFSSAHGGSTRRTVELVVRPARVDFGRLDGVPEAIRQASVTVSIDSVTVAGGEIAVRHASGEPAGDVRVLAWAGDHWAPASDAASSFERDAWLAVFTCAPGCTSRSEPVLLRWPDPRVVSDGLILYSRASR